MDAATATKTIGRFEIRRELGRGAQSVVYLAYDPQLQREVAIKTLHFSRADAARNEALVTEARAVSKLRHPNLVPIFDAGEQDGDPYLVFQYVEGRNLAEVLARDGPIAPAKAADLIRQVADGLAQAHAAGIIHRDLKPSNILIDAQGKPQVMDFGIASRGGESAGGTKGLTGTPAYMAPEYVDRQQVTPKGDVYAAGLVLLEMVTGRRVVEGESLAQIAYKIAHEPVTIPPAAGIDDALSALISTACAKDPELRLESAAAMKKRLDEYLGAAATPILLPGDDEGRKQGTLEFLMRRMRHKSDFPVLSDSVSAINKLTRSDRESINKLSNTILKDYGLTNKIMRLVNSAFYRTAGGGNISTVSRAVIVLGFDAVRNIAITVLLFEHLQDKGNARELKEAFLRANLAGTLARDASMKFMARDAEEAYICALFHNLGQLLAQYYFPEEVGEMRKLILQRGITEEQAAAQVLGITLSDLGIGIAEHWGFPKNIVASLHPLTEGPVHKPATQEQSLRVVAGFANELCDAIVNSPKEDRSKVLHAVGKRFAAAMPFTDKQLQGVLEKSFDEMTELAAVLHVNLKQSPFANQVRGWVSTHAEATEAAVADPMAQTVLGAVDAGTVAAEVEESPLAGDLPVPERAQDTLAAGIQDISNSLVDDFSLNDVLRIILETMYRAMGFQRVLLCLKNAKTGQMAGRFGFGGDTTELARRFSFPLSYAADVFHLATSKGVDIIITDIDDPKIADKIPAWYRQTSLAKTFVLFPLTIKGNPVALIYCDRDKAGSIVIPEKELALLKTLRNQAVLAIKQSM